jgi:3-oxoacyl-[acyl-carrier protein] reductase
MLITGSSRGIGASIARLAKKEGYNVILHGRTASLSLLSLAEEIDSRYLVFDISRPEEITSSLATLDSLDVLVNSAGVNISKPFELLSDEDWFNVYNCNVFGLAAVVRSCLPVLLKSRLPARIINIGSVKGIYSSVGRLAYSSSKASVIHMTVGLAKELAPDILVNCISPGFTNTDMTELTWSPRIKAQVDSILLKRMAEPDEIGSVCLFLASEICTYVTGQNLAVDGGFSIKDI